MKNGKILCIHISIIIGITCILYSISFKNEFVWDDPTLILRNDKIHHLTQIPKLFFIDFFDYETQDGPNSGGYYRPLTMTSFALDWALWKGNVFGYHLTNLLLHLLNGCLIYGIIRYLLGPPSIAFWASLLFLIHPLQVDSVAYISGRTDLLAVFFLFLCLSFNFLEEKAKEKKVWLWLAGLVAYSASLFSKEIGIIVPLLLFIYFFAVKKENLRDTFLRLIPYVLITIGYLILRNIALNLPPGEFLAHLAGFHWRFLSILIAWSQSMTLFLWPTPIYFERFQIHYEHFVPQMGVALLLLFGFFVLLLLLWKKNRPLFFFGALFGFPLLPLLQLHPLFVQEYLFWTEHFFYLPSVGLFTLLIYFIHSLISQNKSFILASSITGTVFVILFSFFTIGRISDWRNEEALFQKAIKHNPKSARAQNNLAITYDGQNKSQLAIQHFKEAIKLDPNSPGAYNNLGNIYKSLGEWDEAKEQFDKAILAGANTSGLFFSLADLYIQQGDLAQAEKIYLAAIPRVKNPHKIYNHLGMLYIKEGREGSAMLMFQKGLEIKPDFILALNNVGILFAKQNQFEKAEALFKQAIDWNPDLAQAHNNLGNLYLLWKRFDQAKKSYEKALELEPDYPDPKQGLKAVISKLNL